MVVQGDEWVDGDRPQFRGKGKGWASTLEETHPQKKQKGLGIVFDASRGEEATDGADAMPCVPPVVNRGDATPNVPVVE